MHRLQVGWSVVPVCMVYMLDSRLYPCAWFTGLIVVCTMCMVYMLDDGLYQCAWFTCWMVVCTSVQGLHVGWSFVPVSMVYMSDGRLYECAWFTC